MSTKMINEIAIYIPPVIKDLRQSLYYITTTLACMYEESHYETRVSIMSKNSKLLWGISQIFPEAEYQSESALQISCFDIEYLIKFASILTQEQKEKLVDHLFLSSLDKRCGEIADTFSATERALFASPVLSSVHDKRIDKVMQLFDEYYPTIEEKKHIMRP